MGKFQALKPHKGLLDLSLVEFVPLLLKLLLIVLFIGFLGGTIKTFIDLRLLFVKNIEEAIRQLLVNAITLLALIEIILTIFSYLSSGRVRVTFVVDTVLIVMINEVISLWFKGPNFSSAALLIFMIFSLIILRILAIRYSPDTENSD